MADLAAFASTRPSRRGPKLRASTGVRAHRPVRRRRRPTRSSAHQVVARSTAGGAGDRSRADRGTRTTRRAHRLPLRFGPAARGRALANRPAMTASRARGISGVFCHEKGDAMSLRDLWVHRTDRRCQTPPPKRPFPLSWVRVLEKHRRAPRRDRAPQSSSSATSSNGRPHVSPTTENSRESASSCRSAWTRPRRIPRP